MTAKSLILVLTLVGMPATAGSTRPPQAGQTPAGFQLPPLSWTCPMHPDVIDVAKGTCPVCRMALEPVRLDSVWSCAVHQVIAEDVAGSCRICGRTLIRLTIALTWTCPGEPEGKRIEPGTCPDGTSAMPVRTLRPHGNHNPQHGGLFFMAPDNWHHLEGAYVEPGVFRVYLYDDYSRPLSAESVRQAAGRVIATPVHDPATRDDREIASVALTPAADGSHLDARVGRLPLPATLTARLRLAAGGEEYRFDFSFPEYSREPPADVALPTRDAASADPALVPLPIPETSAGILAHLRARTAQVGELIERGDLARVYFPAFQAKDLALALLARSGDLSPERRRRLDAAVTRLVRAAWLIDAHGDVGDREQVLQAYTMFTSAVAGVEAVVR